MKLTENAGIVGHIELVSRDAAGRLLEVREIKNMVVNTGLTWIAGALSGDTADPTTMKYVGIGTGTTAAAATDTALETEAESRATGTVTLETTTTADDTFQVVGAITMTGARAVTEAGLFSASESGTLGARRVFDVMNVPSGGSLAITWQWQFARAA